MPFAIKSWLVEILFLFVAKNFKDYQLDLPATYIARATAGSLPLVSYKFGMEEKVNKVLWLMKILVNTADLMRFALPPSPHTLFAPRSESILCISLLLSSIPLIVLLAFVLVYTSTKICFPCSSLPLPPFNF